MKSLLILFFIFKISTLFATEREFRVNKSSATKNVYAIAWGIPCKKLDFEVLDKKSDNEIEEFIATSHIVNYVVDLQTDSILYTVKSKGLVFTIGNTHFGNHFFLSLYPIYFENLSSEQEAVALIENWKTFNNATNLFIIDRSKGVKTILDLNDGQFDKLIKTEIAKNLQGEKLDIFKNGTTYLTDVKYSIISNIGSVSILNLNSVYLKSGFRELNIEATIQFTIINGKAEASVFSVTSKIESLNSKNPILKNSNPLH